MNRKDQIRFEELPEIPFHPDSLKFFIKMTASPHYNEPLEAIMKRKQESIRKNSCVFWPFAASEPVIRNMLEFMQEHKTYWIFFNEGKGARGKNAASPLMARSCLKIGSEIRYPIPDGLSAGISPSRKNSTFSLVIKDFYRIPADIPSVPYSVFDKKFRTFTGIELFERGSEPDKTLSLILAARLKKPYLIRLSLLDPDTAESIF